MRDRPGLDVLAARPGVLAAWLAALDTPLDVQAAWLGAGGCCVVPNEAGATTLKQSVVAATVSCSVPVSDRCALPGHTQGTYRGRAKQDIQRQRGQ